MLDINNSLSTKSDKTNLPNSKSSIRWELKLNHKKPFDSKYKQNEVKSNQLYTRYMERYAESLDSSKHLHHKIITDIKLNNKCKEEKLSVKAKQIQQENDFLKLKKLEEKEINFINSLKIRCYNDINESIKMIDTNKYTKLAKYTLLKLRIKWLQYESIDKKTDLFLFINQAIEIFTDFMSLEDAQNMLNCLKNIGFHSSCEELKNRLANKRKDFENLKKIENKVDSFDHDVLFQLKHCGDKLERTLNSTNDPRVKFQPDKWQKDLLDAVDRNESSLICNFI